LKEVNLEQIIQVVTEKVVAELVNQGVRVVNSNSQSVGNAAYQGFDHGTGFRTKTETLDMSSFKTPILTERQIHRLHELTGAVVVPQGTVITPKARELLKEKQIKLEIK